MSLSSRTGYLLASLAVFASQHGVMLIAMAASHVDVSHLPWWFWINPFRILVGQVVGSPGAGPLALTLGMVATLAVDVGLVLLSFRRARVLEEGSWAAALTIVPILQILAILTLAFSPHRTSPDPPDRDDTRLDARTSVAGLLLGVGLIVVTVALSTLVFGLYGYALFLISPFLIAVAVGYFANRRGRVELKRTLTLVALAFLLGGGALLGFAFEGVLCLVLASPIIAVVGLVGAILGASLADLGRRGRGVTLTSVAFIPILLAAEAMLPPRASFDSVEAVEVAAPPAAVWEAVTHMRPIVDAPQPPFSWGLAYPLRGELLGEGVGAVRRGVFSTGEGLERVTTWEPGVVLALAVLSEPPAMRELSPYAHVNAPHDGGYFRTRDVRFTLSPLPDGRTRLTLASHHDLDLEPALYWMPMAQWAVRTNTRRVLRHLRRQAESQGSPASHPSPEVRPGADLPSVQDRAGVRGIAVSRGGGALRPADEAL